MATQSPVPAVSLQRGIVKQVVSADSLIIRGQPVGGPPPEKQINLAWVQAPKISKRLPPSESSPKGSNTTDEPYGWEGREFLRKKLVGKPVMFKVEYKVPFGQQQRECGVVYLDDENIAETLVSNGYVDVIKRKQNSENEEFQRLVELEQAAIAAGKGKHSGSPGVKREILYDVENPDRLIGKTFDGIVEHVVSGSTLRILLEVKKNTFQQITLMLSGVTSPRNTEPYADEARYFTECRILQKDVKVRIEQVSSGAKNSSQPPFFLGSVTCNKNNIAEHLLREGYAKCSDRSLMQAITPDKLRAAENEAKSKKLRVWKHYEQKAKIDSDTWVGTVIEVVNADALVIQKDGSKEAKKIFLSSIRPPPRPEGADKQIRALYDVPFMFEAREFLRTKLIGKKVNVSVDYIQPKSDAYPEKICASVHTLDGSNTNIAEALVLKGLATVVRHRQDDEQRSAHYDALREAEVKAQNGKKGLHGNPDKGLVRLLDISNDLQKAKQLLPSLQRSSASSRREAVVEHVFSASRLKLYVPKDNCLFNLVLGGITTPKASDPYGPESIQFVRSLVIQRPVQIAVDSMDKAGNFIGSVFHEGKNLSLELVKAGFASVRDDRGAEFRTAEDAAKKKRLNIWKDWKEEVVEDVDKENDVSETTNGETNGVEKKEDRIPVVVTQVAEDMSHFYAQSSKDGPAFTQMLEEMRRELAANPPLPASYTPKKDDIVAAKFSADGQWYRAKIEKIMDKKAEVFYVDYGNREVLPFKSLAALPLPKYHVSHFPPAIRKYTLAYVSLPEDKEVVDESRLLFEAEVFKRQNLLLRVEYTDPATNLEAVTLFDADTKKDIVLKLVEEGCFMLNRKERRKERRLQKTIAEYRSAQELAKKNRLNLWRYGDFTEDDAREFGYKATA